MLAGSKIHLLHAPRTSSFGVAPLMAWSQLTERALMGLVKRCQGVAHYSKYLSNFRLWNYETWRRLPLLTKKDLRNSYPFGLLATDRQDLATYHESTGTTGAPSASYFTEGDWHDIVSRFRRNAVQLRAQDTVLIKTPYSMVTTAHQMHRAAREAGALVIPADNRSSNMPYPKVIRLLKDLNVTVAWCMPTELLLWAEAARLLGLDPAHAFPSLRAFVVAGESLSAAKKARLQRLWGNVAIYEDYGSTETGSLAGGCSEGVLHAWGDRLLFEVWNEAKQRTQLEGRGSLVVSTLYREGMPLLRYNLEDEVELEYRLCPCGSHLPILKILGRPASLLQFTEKEVYQAEIEEAVYSLCETCSVVVWRARQVGQTLEVEIEVDDLHAIAACDELSHEIFKRCSIKAEVKGVCRGTILNHRSLLEETTFRKPRFLFAETESWHTALTYS